MGTHWSVWWIAVLLALPMGAHAAPPANDTPRTTEDSRSDASDRQLLLTLRALPPHYRPDVSYGGYGRAPGRDARRRLAKALSKTHGLRLLDDWAIPALGVDCFVLEAPSAGARAAKIEALAADPRVDSVQAMHVFRALTGGDPLARTQPAVVDWRLRELHALATGRGVAIAMLDSGVDARHPDLHGQPIQTRNFVADGAFVAEAHGTAVAGIIGARASDGIGIAGIAPGATLMALRACTQREGGSATCNSFSLAKAIQFALQADVQILNLSLTGPPDPLLARMLDVALRRGITVVGAADAEAAGGGFPAMHPGVFAVAGSHQSRPLTPLMLRTTATGIPAPVAGGGWSLVSGTSFAAAQVSGLVALLRELSPQLSAGELGDALLTRSRLGSASRRPQSVDACAAVEHVVGRCACRCAIPREGIAAPRR